MAASVAAPIRPPGAGASVRTTQRSSTVSLGLGNPSSVVTPTHARAPSNSVPAPGGTSRRGERVSSLSTITASSVENARGKSGSRNGFPISVASGPKPSGKASGPLDLDLLQSKLAGLGETALFVPAASAQAFLGSPFVTKPSTPAQNRVRSTSSSVAKPAPRAPSTATEVKGKRDSAPVYYPDGLTHTRNHSDTTTIFPDDSVSMKAAARAAAPNPKPKPPASQSNLQRSTHEKTRSLPQQFQPTPQTLPLSVQQQLQQQFQQRPGTRTPPNVDGFSPSPAEVKTYPRPMTRLQTPVIPPTGPPTVVAQTELNSPGITARDGPAYTDEANALSPWEHEYRFIGPDTMTDMAHNVRAEMHQDHQDLQAQFQAEREALLRGMHAEDSTKLATALARLEDTQRTLRDVQATMIAERLERCRLERDLKARENKTLGYKEQLYTAAEALRRLKKEGQKSEEDKQRIAFAFEEAKNRYKEELKLREARDVGRDEGRREAWEEAERWIGPNPLIPGAIPVVAPAAVPFAAPAAAPVASLQPAYVPTPESVQVPVAVAPPTPAQVPIPAIHPVPIQQPTPTWTPAIAAARVAHSTATAAPEVVGPPPPPQIPNALNQPYDDPQNFGQQYQDAHQQLFPQQQLEQQQSMQPMQQGFPGPEFHGDYQFPSLQQPFQQQPFQQMPNQDFQQAVFQQPSFQQPGFLQPDQVPVVGTAAEYYNAPPANNEDTAKYAPHSDNPAGRDFAVGQQPDQGAVYTPALTAATAKSRPPSAVNRNIPAAILSAQTPAQKSYAPSPRAPSTRPPSARIVSGSVAASHQRVPTALPTPAASYAPAPSVAAASKARGTVDPTRVPLPASMASSAVPSRAPSVAPPSIAPSKGPSVATPQWSVNPAAVPLPPSGVPSTVHTRAPSIASAAPRGHSVYADHLLPTNQPPAPLIPGASGSRPPSVATHRAMESNTEKPLPIPSALGHGSRPQSIASQVREPSAGHKRTVSQPASLHAHQHLNLNASGLGEGRYPVFPGARAPAPQPEEYDPLGPIDPTQLIYRPKAPKVDKPKKSEPTEPSHRSEPNEPETLRNHPNVERSKLAEALRDGTDIGNPGLGFISEPYTPAPRSGKYQASQAPHSQPPSTRPPSTYSNRPRAQSEIRWSGTMPDLNVPNGLGLTGLDNSYQEPHSRAPTSSHSKTPVEQSTPSGEQAHGIPVAAGRSPSHVAASIADRTPVQVLCNVPSKPPSPSPALTAHPVPRGGAPSLKSAAAPATPAINAAAPSGAASSVASRPVPSHSSNPAGHSTAYPQGSRAVPSAQSAQSAAPSHGPSAASVGRTAPSPATPLSHAPSAPVVRSVAPTTRSAAPLKSAAPSVASQRTPIPGHLPGVAVARSGGASSVAPSVHSGVGPGAAASHAGSARSTAPSHGQSVSSHRTGMAAPRTASRGAPSTVAPSPAAARTGQLAQGVPLPVSNPLAPTVYSGYVDTPPREWYAEEKEGDTPYDHNYDYTYSYAQPSDPSRPQTPGRIDTFYQAVGTMLPPSKAGSQVSGFSGATRASRLSKATVAPPGYRRPVVPQ